MEIPFYIGQKVVCINTNGTIGLVKDKEYTIIAMRTGCCNIVELDVNIPVTPGYTNYATLCIKCNKSKIHNNPNNWYKQSRFVPLDILEQEIEMSQFDKILK